MRKWMEERVCIELRFIAGRGERNRYVPFVAADTVLERTWETTPNPSQYSQIFSSFAEDNRSVVDVRSIYHEEIPNGTVTTCYNYFAFFIFLQNILEIPKNLKLF